MEWHCSAYWGHALNENQVEHSKKTLNILETQIAIPILIKRSENEYIKLAETIVGIL